MNVPVGNTLIPFYVPSSSVLCTTNFDNGGTLIGNGYYLRGNLTTDSFIQNSVSPVTTTTYTITCSIPSTVVYYAGSDSATVTVSGVPPAPTVVVSVNPSSIIAGNNSAVSWSSTNTTSCTGTNFSTGGATSGTVVVSPGSTTTYTVTCTGAGGSTSDSKMLTVTASCIPSNACAATTCSTTTCSDTCGNSYQGTKSCVATPELSAGSLTPTTAVAGVSTTFTLPVSNTGAGNAPNFTSLMQRTTTIDANGVAVGPVLDVSTGVTGTFVERTRSLFEKFFLPLAYGATGDPIPANGTGRALFLYTFPPGDAGSTLYLRGCADKSSAADAVGIVAESNENNNCGSWTAVSVTGAAAAAVTSCVPSSASVPANTPVTWSITTSGFSPAPNTYSWSAPGGTPSSGSSASFTTQYAAGGTYSPSITASNGTQSAGPQSCTSVTVTGGACTEAGPVVVTAAPNRVQAGVPTPVTFTSSASNSNGPCTLSGPGIISQAYSPTACTLASKNYTPTLTLTQQSTYTLSCQGGQTGKVIVNIVPKVREF